MSETIELRDYQNGILSVNSNAIFSRELTLEYIGEIWNNTTAGDKNIYFPSIIRTRNLNALGKYYLYYGYDHEYASGNNVGIKMAYSDDLIHWTLYGNVLKASTQLGLSSEQETETPCVYWDEANERYLMMWHSNYKANNGWWFQTTHISESSDGITWTYVKRLCTLNKDRYSGLSNHDGYAHVQKINGIYTVCLLWNGGDAARCNTGYSFDGVNWIFNSHQRAEAERYMDGTAIMPVGYSPVYDIDGKLYKVGSSGKETSGTGISVVHNVSIGEVAGDLLTYIGKARIIYKQSGKQGEYNVIRATSRFTDTDGTNYVIMNYRNGSASTDATSFVLYKICYKK